MLHASPMNSSDLSRIQSTKLWDKGLMHSLCQTLLRFECEALVFIVGLGKHMFSVGIW